jgi:dipeptidyl aminopeptidase/acylaminoacyl peptidase
METGETKPVFAEPGFDVSLEGNEPLFADRSGMPLAVHVEKERGHWFGLVSAWKSDLDFLSSTTTGDVNVGMRSRDDNRWIVAFTHDNQPTSYLLYEREGRRLTPLWEETLQLQPYTLARVHPITIKARDGLKMLCYLTLPPDSDRDHDGRPDRALPMVLNVHGGPTSRDGWGFNTECQFLANRGYAVLQVNFRGSSGFGRKHEHLGHRQWGRAMHTDLLDGVAWAVEQKIADPAKVAVYGGSYGGYASLWAITQSPEVFNCCVAIVGPSNLNTFIENIPRDWPEDYWAATLGDWRTVAGREELNLYSPITYAAKVKRPVLIVQGENDPRVVKSESDQMAQALQSAGARVTYALYPDEGHGIGKPENIPGFWALIENYLAQPDCLGGRCEPFGDSIKGSSLQIPIGEDKIPGLSEARKR